MTPLAPALLSLLVLRCSSILLPFACEFWLLKESFIPDSASAAETALAGTEDERPPCEAVPALAAAAAGIARATPDDPEMFAESILEYLVDLDCPDAGAGLAPLLQQVLHCGDESLDFAGAALLAAAAVGDEDLRAEVRALWKAGDSDGCVGDDDALVEAAVLAGEGAALDAFLRIPRYRLGSSNAGLALSRLPEDVRMKALPRKLREMEHDESWRDLITACLERDVIGDLPYELAIAVEAYDQAALERERRAADEAAAAEAALTGAEP
jgi:hypothetical protein